MVVGDEGSFGGCSDEPVVPDVGDDQVPGADQVFVLAEEFLGDFAFPNFGVRESPDDGHSIGCAEQREAESPEVAGVGGAVSVTGVPCQLGAFHGLAGFPAGNRGRVQKSCGLGPGWRVAGQFGDHGRQQPGGLADSLAPPGLLRQIREHVPQLRVGGADPFPVRRDPEELLGHDQAEQLDIGEDRFAAGMSISGKPQRGDDPIVKMDLKCGQEGV